MSEIAGEISLGTRFNRECIHVHTALITSHSPTSTIFPPSKHFHSPSRDICQADPQPIFVALRHNTEFAPLSANGYRAG